MTSPKFPQTVPAVVSNPLHALLVDAKSFEVALMQPTRNPAPLRRVERRPEDQRRRRFEEVFKKLRRHPRRRPRRDITRRDHTGVAETGDERHIGLSFDYRDLAPMGAQVEGGGD